MKKMLFLDLEETLIDDWHTKNILHLQIQKIKKEIIEPHSFDSAVLFSFAVWDEEEKNHFDIFLKEKLEELLGITITVQTMEQVFEKVLKKNGITGERREFSDIFLFNAKFQLFSDWIKLMKENNILAILVDDTVEDQELLLKKSNNLIQFFNPKD
jgi:hypothetical protein